MAAPDEDNLVRIPKSIDNLLCPLIVGGTQLVRLLLSKKPGDVVTTAQAVPKLGLMWRHKTTLGTHVHMGGNEIVLVDEIIDGEDGN